MSIALSEDVSSNRIVIVLLLITQSVSVRTSVNSEEAQQFTSSMIIHNWPS